MLECEFDSWLKLGFFFSPTLPCGNEAHHHGGLLWVMCIPPLFGLGMVSVSEVKLKLDVISAVPLHHMVHNLLHTISAQCVSHGFCTPLRLDILRMHVGNSLPHSDFVVKKKKKILKMAIHCRCYGYFPQLPGSDRVVRHVHGWNFSAVWRNSAFWKPPNKEVLILKFHPLPPPSLFRYNFCQLRSCPALFLNRKLPSPWIQFSAGGVGVGKRGSSSPGPSRPLDPSLVFLILSFQKFHPCM